MNSRAYHVYILASHKHGTLYVGLTGDLPRRLAQHRSDAVHGFTRRYGVKRLVHAETYDDLETTRARERRLKRWQRAWKIALIEETNLEWRDLMEDIL